ncbi:MAG: MFS transporter, partial [Chloroflexi bacterium]|nr:MFS transporter [Chloroflexota bacterium]
WLIEKLGPRAVTRLGVVMLGVGFMLFSQIDSVLSYYLTFALMAIGASLATFLTVSSAVVNWFIKKRALAIGLTMSGFGFGGLLVPFVAWSLLTFGWRATAFYSGVLVLLLGLPIAQIMRRAPEDYGYLPDGEIENDADRTAASHLAEERATTAALRGEPADFTLREAMRTSSFWLLSVGHGLAVLTVGAVSLHLIPHVVDRAGLSIPTAAGAVAAMTAFNIVGQLGGGLLGDRVSKRAVAAGCMLLHSAAMIILAYATSIVPVFIFAVMHGLAWGTRGPMMTTIRADYFGRTHFASIMGFSSLIVMLGMIGGPLFAGFMADIADGYTTGFVVIAFLTATGSIFFLLSTKPTQPLASRLPSDALSP